MTSASTLKAVVDSLDAAAIPHMVAGSFASSLHGLARSTADIDIVLDPTNDALDDFVEGLDPVRFYVDRASARRALIQRDQFNVVDLQTGWKVDPIVRKDRPFSASEFRRRTSTEIFGVTTFVATAEDTIIAKLEWTSIGGSDRQGRDVVEILRIQRGDLDDGYLDHWAVELGLSDQLDQARRAARDG